MTKEELIEAMKDWPDDTEVEISIPIDFDKPLEGRLWLDIEAVEQPTDIDFGHCLIYADKVTMV